MKLNYQSLSALIISKTDILNWTGLQKSILVLGLGGTAHVLWIIWFYFCSTLPSLKHWMDADYFLFHITRMIVFGLLSFVLIIPCYCFRRQPLAQKFFPFIAISFFAFTFMYGGYSIGITSPATIGSYISLVSVGFVLFNRGLMYTILLPITVYLLGAIYFTTVNAMVYAPIFSAELKSTVLFHNEFWIWSMLFLYIPIFLASIVLFEILLIQWRKREQMIKEISLIDPLTGVYNRRHIYETLLTLEQEQQHYALILLDLDLFKRINDTYGHDVGDRVLKRVAKILQNQVTENDIVGRFGGEEFLIILKQKSLQEALDIAELCRFSIEKEPISIGNKNFIHISASFGVTEFKNLHLSKDELIRQADQALYYAKKQGRNSIYSFFDLPNDGEDNTFNG